MLGIDLSTMPMGSFKFPIPEEKKNENKTKVSDSPSDENSPDNT